MEKPEAIGFDLTKLGFPAQYNTLIPEDDRRFPRLDFTGGTGAVAYGNDFRPVASHTIAATLNKSAGAHSLKAGVEIRIYGERSRPTGNAKAGQYAFTNTYTRQNSASGTDYQGLQAYASFLLGMPSTTSISRLPDYDEQSITSGFFVQDDWRVNNKLTLNLGLRYEFETALTESQNSSVSGFDFDYVQPIQAAAQANYAALNDPALKALVPQLSVKGGLMFAGVDGGSGLYTTPKNTFLPRFGLAYQVTPKTVLRGGAGLFAGFLGERRGDVIQSGYSQTTTVGTTTNAFGAPIPRTGITRSSRPRSSNRSGTRRPADVPRAGDLLLQPESEGVEAASLADGRAARAAGRHDPRRRVRRQLRVRHRDHAQSQRAAESVPEHGQLPQRRDERQQHLPDELVTNPFAGLLPGTGLNNPTIARSQLLLPYPRSGPSTPRTTTASPGISRPVRLAEAVLEGLRAGRLLHLFAVDAGHRVPERERPAADQDDLGSGRDEPAVAQRHLELPVREGPPVRVGGERAPERAAWRLAGSGRLHLADRLSDRVRHSTAGRRLDAFYNGGDIATSDPSSKWFNTAPSRRC